MTHVLLLLFFLAYDYKYIHTILFMLFSSGLIFKKPVDMSFQIKKNRLLIENVTTFMNWLMVGCYIDVFITSTGKIAIYTQDAVKYNNT